MLTGVDYPGVSHVIQFGIPESREQYIHRLGRTGRAGAEGKGWLVLGPFESLFLEELKGLHVPNDERLRQLLSDPVSAEIEDLFQPAIDRIRSGDRKLTPSAEGAYQSFLGYYLGQMKRMKMKNKNDLVRIANLFSSLMGLSEVPALPKNMVSKMGLKGVDGIIVSTLSFDENGKRGGGSDGGRKDHVDGRRAPDSGRRMRRG
jgi:ATP-dependent RNA helicase MSS116